MARHEKRCQKIKTNSNADRTWQLLIIINGFGAVAFIWSMPNAKIEFQTRTFCFPRQGKDLNKIQNTTKIQNKSSRVESSQWVIGKPFECQRAGQIVNNKSNISDTLKTTNFSDQRSKGKTRTKFTFLHSKRYSRGSTLNEKNNYASLPGPSSLVFKSIPSSEESLL